MCSNECVQIELLEVFRLHVVVVVVVFRVFSLILCFSFHWRIDLRFVVFAYLCRVTFSCHIIAHKTYTHDQKNKINETPTKYTICAYLFNDKTNAPNYRVLVSHSLRSCVVVFSHFNESIVWHCFHFFSPEN